MPETHKIFLGTYRLEESDNFEAFMQKLGVSPFWLLSDGVTKPIMVISYVVQLGQFKMETRTALKKTELVFKINEDFIEITADVNLSHKMSVAMFATAKIISMF